MERIIGQYIHSDPQVCHGTPVFRGTRIMVKHVLEMVEEGLPWDEIVAQWRGRVTKEAIAEAVRLARLALLDHGKEYLSERGRGGARPVEVAAHMNEDVVYQARALAGVISSF
jgi:Uncharacterized conserved protein